MLIDDKILAKRTANTLNPQTDLVALALQNPDKWEKDFLSEVINQFKITEKLKSKIPSWAKVDGIIGGSLLNIEQCSSEISAQEKFKDLSGDRAIDLTGGFGVDTFFLAQKFKEVIYCEANAELVEIVKHNFQCLQINNVIFYHGMAEDFLTENAQLKADLIYADPDRRSADNKKLIRIADCKPDMEALSNTLLHISERVLIKYSPMLDISLALNSLAYCQKVTAVAVLNEVKELLFDIRGGFIDETQIEAKNLHHDIWQKFQYTLENEQDTYATFSDPLQFLYEPNAAILKTGAFKSIAEAYALKKLATNSHFYTSDELRAEFPGKILKVKELLGTSSKDLKKFKNEKVNIIARNYPIGTDIIKKKYHLMDGGDSFLVFTQNAKGQKIAIFAEKINLK